jgi:hypothetical protein
VKKLGGFFIGHNDFRWKILGVVKVGVGPQLTSHSFG